MMQIFLRKKSKNSDKKQNLKLENLSVTWPNYSNKTRLTLQPKKLSKELIRRRRNSLESKRSKRCWKEIRLQNSEINLENWHKIIRQGKTYPLQFRTNPLDSKLSHFWSKSNNLRARFPPKRQTWKRNCRRTELSKLEEGEIVQV